MDPTLAEIYGTNGGAEEQDLEKLAAAELAEGLTEEEGVDLASMDPDEIEALAQDVLDADGSTESDPEDMEKEAQAKFEEADYTGRIMAHAYVNELEKIAAGKKKGGPSMKVKVKRLAHKAGKKIGKGADKAEKAGRKVTDSVAKGVAGAAKRVGGAAKGAYHGAGGPAAMSAAKKGAGKVGKFMLKHRGKGAIGAAALGAGAAAHHQMKKSASALDTLAEQRALEILNENGIEIDEEGQVKEAAAETDQQTVLEAAVESRAQEMLAANGFELEAEEQDETDEEVEETEQE